MSDKLFERILNYFPNSEFVGIKRKYTTGNSGAPVYAVQYRALTPYGLSGAFIVKIGSEAWAQREATLYNNLSHSAFKPLLAASCMVSNSIEGKAAVAYRIAFDSLIMPKPLMDVLDEKDQSVEETQQQIKDLIQTLVNCYSEVNLVDQNVVEDPHTLLCRMLTIRRTSNLLERLEQTLPFWNSDSFQISVEGRGSPLPNPLMYMQKETWSKKKIDHSPNCPVSRIHGDLHTGNIICPPLLQNALTQLTPMIIDFDQDAINSVPFFDFAYLEFDIIRHLLPVDKPENRGYWLSLLEVSMAEIDGGQQNLAFPWDADRAWQFIKPIRQGVLQLQALGGEDYSLVWWLSTVAVGLNFARKGEKERSTFERIAGLLYAAFGLAGLLKQLRVKESMTEQPPMVHWLSGNDYFPRPLDLHSVPAYLETHNAFSTELEQRGSTETSLDAANECIQPAQLERPFNQMQLAISEPAMESFESILPSFSGVDPLSISHDSAEDQQTNARNSMGETEENTLLADLDNTLLEISEKISLSIHTENASLELVERIQELLQPLLGRFQRGGQIYRDECDTADKSLCKVVDYLHEVSNIHTPRSYQVQFDLENILELLKSIRSSLHSFRESCPPFGLDTRRIPQSRYDEKRDAITNKLDVILAQSIIILKNLTK